MPRPMAKQRHPAINKNARYLIIDGYVDEPAALGVPPYLAPQVRSLAGGLVSGGAKEEEIQYLTVDQWRDLRGKWTGSIFGNLEALMIVKGCVVPGKYLRGTPISERETTEIMIEIEAPIQIITGAGITGSGDMGVLGEGVSSEGREISRKRTMEEWEQHLLDGAFLAGRHPDHPSPLICEIETSEGCPRYITGGCSFCMEPGRGPVRFREPDSVIEEVRYLSENGVENIRIGGQSDLLTYLSPDVGRTDIPEPDPEPLDHMMSGVKDTLHGGAGVRKASESGSRTEIDTGIIHTDNANPAVIAAYPGSSTSALEAIIKGSTSGSVLAFGLESADPDVRKINNLNSSANEVREAVDIMNRVGGRRGKNGLPMLLPGINFLGGLKGQGPSSFDHDTVLLESILEDGNMVRRINIRKAIFQVGQKDEMHDKEEKEMWKRFDQFRSKVRERFDTLFLERMLPAGSVLRGIYVETSSGHVFFGRQIGSYPILVGIPHEVKIDSYVDVAITDVSSRSVTGFRTPFSLSTASFRDLSAIPGIGKKRAATVFRNPSPDNDALAEIAKGENGWILDHLTE